MNENGDAHQKVVEEFVQFAEVVLADYLDKPGLVIYTKADTLKQTDVIFWGYNPGGNLDVADPTAYSIRKALCEFRDRTWSFLDDSWPNTRLGEKGIGRVRDYNIYLSRHASGQDPYQKGISRLLNFTGHPDALVTNFIFQQTQNVDDACRITDLGDLIKACCKVHSRVFEITKAKVLFVTPATRDDLQKFMHVKVDSVDGPKSGYSNCHVKKWRWNFGTQELTVIEVPHMSLWGNIICNQKNPHAPNALNWIKAQVDKALGNRPPNEE